MKLLIELPEDTYISVCNESMLPPDVANVVNAIKRTQPLFKNATNGDMIKAMFPDLVNSNLDLVDVLNNAKSWWNTKYKRIEE